MRQILINLIENALDALSPGGKMYVSVRPIFKLASRRPGYSLRVADSGHGISRAVMPKLFTPFFSTKGSSGTGLGLLIIRQIIEKHGGDLSVRSRKVSERLCRSGSLCSRIQAAEKRCRRNPNIMFWRGRFHSRRNSRVNHAVHRRFCLSRHIRSSETKLRFPVLPSSPRQHAAPIHSSGRRSTQS